jgi:hypothetical protein
MKKYAHLILFLAMVVMVGCARDEKSLVITTGKKTLVYRELTDIPKIIEVKGPCRIFSQKYPITVHFPDPDNPAEFYQNGDFFREGHEAPLTGKTNISRIYQVWFHSGEVRGAEYLNAVLRATTIKLLK